MMILIPQWRQAWRMFSVQAATLLLAWASLSPEMQAALVGWAGFPRERVPAVLAALVLLCRLLHQPSLHGEPTEPPAQ